MEVNTDEAGRWYYNSARNFTVDKYSLILNLPQDEAVKDIGLIKSLPDVAFLMLTSILYDMQYYQGCSALLKKYKEMRDKLSPDLVEILEADYGDDNFPPHGVIHPEIIVQQMIDNGELDLTSFKDENGVVSYSKRRTNLYVTRCRITWAVSSRCERNCRRCGCRHGWKSTTQFGC